MGGIRHLPGLQMDRNALGYVQVQYGENVGATLICRYTLGVKRCVRLWRASYFLQ